MYGKILSLAHQTSNFSFVWVSLRENLALKHPHSLISALTCTDSESFFQRGSKFDICFSWWGEEGSKYHSKRTMIRPPAKHHLNDVSLACRWWPNIECWLGSYVFFQGIRTNIAKKPYMYVIFQGGVPSPPPLWIRTCLIIRYIKSIVVKACSIQIFSIKNKLRSWACWFEYLFFSRTPNTFLVTRTVWCFCNIAFDKKVGEKDKM